MPTAEVLDFAKLLTAVAGENPAGVDLRTDTSPKSVYYQIRGTRTTARDAERLALLGGEAAPENRPDWKPVLQLAPDVLAERSKDLEIAAYLIEALGRRNGFAGLRDGFRLARELIERFWEHLYPLPDEDGVVTRVAPLTGLNGEDGEGTLIAPIQNMAITDATSVGAFATWQYKQASDLARIEDATKRQQRIDQGALSMQVFQTAVNESSAEFYRELLADLGQCSEEFEKLCRVLEEKCGADSPPSSNIRNALSDCRHAIQSIARDKLGVEVEAESVGAADAAGGSAAPAGAGVAAGPLRSREDALRTLGQVAEYFRRSEPHSPLSYCLEQAVRWGKMPLPALLEELIPEGSAREELFKLIGIRPSGQS